MTPSGARLGAVWAIIILVAIGLTGIDQFLSRVDASETRSSARRAHVKGMQLLREGKASEAVDSLREAYAQDRANIGYERDLVEALLADGKTADAEPMLTEVLQREPNDGEANLIAARMSVRKGQTREAEAYYHRAIYGEWPGNAATDRDAARMELVDVLAAKNQKQELLAELISLEAESPGDTKVQKRLGPLFLKAGSPPRAAATYEALIAKNPDDVSAYEGLAEADLQEGQYAPARAALQRASALKRDNPEIRAQLETLDTVTQLDPTGRHLTSAEKYRRSVLILRMARAALAQCTEPNSAQSQAQQDQQLLKAADTTINGKDPAHVTNEAAENVLSLAEQLWHAGTVCSGREDQGALSLIMRKLAS